MASPTVAAADDRLIWIDLEMTGLRPDADRILEVALVVTDASLATIAEAPVWVVHQADAAEVHAGIRHLAVLRVTAFRKSAVRLQICY